MTKIELVGEILKVCDEKEKLEIDNKILREKLDECERVNSNSKSNGNEDNLSIKTKLMFANYIIDDEVKSLHKSTTEDDTLSHNGNILGDSQSYYPNYEKGMTFEEWLDQIELYSIDSYTKVGCILKKMFSLNDIKQLFLEAYREVFNFLKKKYEENDGDEKE